MELNYFADQSGALETREVGGGLDLDFRDGSTASLGVKDLFEQVTDPFSVSGATVAPGRYDFSELSLSYEASRARAFSGRVNVGGGGVLRR